MNSFLSTLIIFAFCFMMINIKDLKSDEKSEYENNVVITQLNEKWKKDTNTIMSIITEIRKFRKLDKDTTLQVQDKEKKLNSEIIRINKKLNGKMITFESVRVLDVKANKKLSKSGVKTLNEILKEITKNKEVKNNLLLSQEFKIERYFYDALVREYEKECNGCCSECWEDSNDYTITYEIPIPEFLSFNNNQEINHYNIISGIPVDDSYIRINIKKITTDKQESISLKTNKLYKITGKIMAIFYQPTLLEELVVFVIR